MGAMFDADGDGTPEKVFYNGHSPVAPDGRGTHGEVGAVALGIQGMAESCVQGRGVLLDFHHHFGATPTSVGYDDLMRLLDNDGIEELGRGSCRERGWQYGYISGDDVS